MSQIPVEKVTLITGANRGIGLEFVSQSLTNGYKVIACCRNPSKAEKLKEFQSKNKDNLVIEKLEVTNDNEINELLKKYKNKPIDLVILNAGISGQSNIWKRENLTRENLLLVLNTNAVSTVLLAEKLYENVKLSNGKHIIAMSSRTGSIERSLLSETVHVIPYRMSKSAINMGMACLARISELNKDKVRVNSVCPGWVKTDMGTDKATLTPEESVKSMFEKIINNSKTLKNGGFYNHEGKVIPY